MIEQDKIEKIAKWIEMGKPVGIIKAGCRKKWPDEAADALILSASSKYLESLQIRKAEGKEIDIDAMRSEFQQLVDAHRIDDALTSLQRFRALPLSRSA
jgi:hypothetical protein